MLRLTVIIMRIRPEDKHLKRLTIYNDQYERTLQLTRARYPLRTIEQAFTCLAPAIPCPDTLNERWDPALFLTPKKIEEMQEIKRHDVLIGA